MNLKEARKKARLKLREVADEVHTTIRTVVRWESGSNDISTEILKKLSALYGVSVDELLNGPAPNELKFNIVWEVNEMNMIDIPNNQVFLGFKPSFNVIAGAFPEDADPDDIGRRVANELRAARAARAVREAELRKGVE